MRSSVDQADPAHAIEASEDDLSGMIGVINGFGFSAVFYALLLAVWWYW